MLEFLKDAVRGLIGAALRLRVRLSTAPLAIALVYHKVGDPAESRASGKLVPALGTALFRGQITHLNRCYRLVSASELVEAARDRRRGDRIPVAITFDDDLACHLETAAPILLDLRAPATFFLTGAALDGPFEFWWERLDRAFATGVVGDADLRDLVDQEPRAGETAGRAFSTAIEAMPQDEQDRIAEAMLERLGTDAPDSGLRRSQVARLAELGFEVGFHTRRHQPLSRLTGEALATAMEDGREQVEAAVGQVLRTIAYPHGKADRRVAEAARTAGFEAGFTTSSKPLDGTTDPLLIGRFYPSETSVGRMAWVLVRALASGVSRP